MRRTRERGRLESKVPQRIIRNIAMHPNFGGHTSVPGRACGGDGLGKPTLFSHFVSKKFCRLRRIR